MHVDNVAIYEQVTLAALTNVEVNEFRAEVAKRMRLPPWDTYMDSAIAVST